VLALLRRVAEDSPVLAVLDDAHWADRASVEALAFVARHVQGSRIGLLAAFRPGVDEVYGWRALPRQEVAPLPEREAAVLLEDQHPLLERRATSQVLREAAGNPLALLELPAALGSQNRRTDVSSTPALPLTRRLQALYSDQVEQLPAASRDLLLVAALEGAGDVPLSLRAVEGRAGLYDMAPAERAGLVRVDDAAEQIHFRHPLVRATVIELASPAKRAWAHGRLARALPHDPVRQALHLAAAAQGCGGGPSRAAACCRSQPVAGGPQPPARGGGLRQRGRDGRAARRGPAAGGGAARRPAAAQLAAGRRGRVLPAAQRRR
jgi:hypothetical protein